MAAQEWKRLDRSTDALYRGVPLAEALAWRARAGDRLNWLERDFLDAGSALDRSIRHARGVGVTTAFVALATALAVIAVVAVIALGSSGAWRSRVSSRRRRTPPWTSTPRLSLTLALRAIDVAHTELADQVLRQATATSQGRSIIEAPGGAVYGVRLLPDGRWSADPRTVSSGCGGRKRRHSRDTSLHRTGAPSTRFASAPTGRAW